MKCILCVVLVFFGCSSKEELPLSIPDSGVISEATQHVCQEPLILTDFYNCGSCGNQCNSDVSNVCVNGYCGCGTESSCESSRCVNAHCVAPDPGELCINNSDCPATRRTCISGHCNSGCEFDDQCGGGGFACIYTQCTRIECVPEVCDGLDNDCDGDVDGAGGNPLSEFCFSGPDITNILPPCMRGVRLCVEGAWSSCIGEFAPATEQGLLGCDGLDNNCDGCVDGDFADGVCVGREAVFFDIVYVMDISGSMADNIMAAKLATSTFSSTFSGNPAFRFGLVIVPGVSVDPVAELVLDLSDFVTFDAELSRLTDGAGGAEPQLDAVYELGTGEIPISWRIDSARIIIVFTDEVGQSYRVLRRLSAVDESLMCSALDHGEVLAVVTGPLFYSDFDECAMLFELTNDAVMMASQLNTIIADPCR
jgi:hypothetical protein